MITITFTMHSSVNDNKNIIHDTIDDHLRYEIMMIMIMIMSIIKITKVILVIMMIIIEHKLIMLKANANIHKTTSTNNRPASIL